MAGSTSDYQQYEQWEKRKNSAWANFTRQITPVHFISLGVLIILGMYLIQQNSQNKTFVIAGIILVVLILAFKRDKAADKTPIAENVAKIITEKALKRKIGNELPWGTTVSSALWCRMRYDGEWGTPFRPWKWEVSFDITYPDGNKKTALILLEPWEGYITGITLQSGGYTGELAQDLKYIPVGIMKEGTNVPKNI